MLNLTVQKDELKLIVEIVKRARRDFPEQKIDSLELNMDLCAVHANSCKLNLKKLLEFPLFEFGHDIFGIQRHINRQTGNLENCFLPRCARPCQTEEDNA